jgi:RecA/RadA recombinase
MEKLKKQLLERPKQRKLKDSDFLSSGSTLLNLACTDRIDGGLVKGVYHNLTGDSDTGKSIVAVEILAQAALNKNFKKHRLVYWNAERANLLTYPHLEDRLEVLEPDTLEDFYYTAYDFLKGGWIVGILDSMDALIPKADDKKFLERKKAHQAGKEAKGSYGSKAKVNSENLRRLVSALGDDSIFLMISQTRDLMDSMMFGPQKTRSGGHSLKFYNRWEVWINKGKKIEKTYKGEKVQIGTYANVKVEKNHITGKKRKVKISVYTSYGIDDIGDCINFLIQWKHWKGTETKVRAPEFDFDGDKDKLIKKIDKKKSRLWKLRRIVGRVWRDIEDTVALSRRPKYEE